MKARKPKPPILGMKLMPYGMGIMGGGDFVSCVYWAATVPAMTKQFREDTGMDFIAIIKVRGIEAMVDNATGRQAATIAAFADWVCERVWGEA